MTTPTKEDKLKVIYEEVASKDLSFGCLVYLGFNDFTYGKIIITKVGWYDILGHVVDCEDERDDLLSISKDKAKEKGMEVIGHPVLIGDCLKWIQDQPNWDKAICNQCGEEYILLESIAYCPDYNCGSEEDYTLLYEERCTLLKNRTDPSLPIDDNEEAIDFMYNLIVNYKNGSETTPTEA